MGEFEGGKKTSNVLYSCKEIPIEMLYEFD